MQDQTGAVLANAAVDLVTANGAVLQSTTTDGSGAFRFERVAAGQYQILARYEGFAPSSARVRVATRPPVAQKLVLAIAGLTQEITVSSAGDTVDASAANNADAVSVDTNMLAGLPMFDNDVVATMSRFLDSGSLGNGGATIVVNGMEVAAVNVSASAIQQIRINQDPYSAEYSRPGRGRIEILTKPGGQQYHVDLNTIARSANLNARNPFATTKQPEDRYAIDGFLGGPLGSSGKTSFMLSANDANDNRQAFVHALGPDGLIEDSLPQSSGRALVSGSVTHQISERNTFSIRPNYQYESDENRGVGGTTLVSAATTFTHHEQQVTYTQQTVLRPTLIHQIQVLVGHEREPTTSASPDRAIVVAGAFTGGGGQSDLVRTETHMNLNESVAWTSRASPGAGGIPASGLEPARVLRPDEFWRHVLLFRPRRLQLGRPYPFTQQRGNGDLAFLEKQVGAYVKDDWQVHAGLSLSFGMRYDWQNYFTTTTTWRRASRSPMRQAIRRRRSCAPAPECSTIAAARS